MLYYYVSLVQPNYLTMIQLTANLSYLRGRLMGNAKHESHDRMSHLTGKTLSSLCVCLF